MGNPSAALAALRDAAVAWVAAARPDDAAAPVVAGALEDVAGYPVVVVRGPAGCGADTLARRITEADAARGWLIGAEEGPVHERWADVAVSPGRDTSRRRREVRGIPVLPVAADADPAQVVSQVSEVLDDVEGVASRRLTHLREELARAAAEHPPARAGLEELLWPAR